MATLLLVTEDYPLLTGGIATFLQSLKRFSSNRITVLTTVSLRSPGQEPDVFRVRALHGLGFVILLAASFALILRRRPKLILWGHTSWVAVVGWLWGRVFRLPLVVLAHGNDLHASLASGWPRRSLALFTLRRCHLIFANSQYTATKVTALGISPKKVKVIHPGVDIRFFKPMNHGAGLDKSPLPQGPVLLSVGRLVRRKNHEAVLKAIPEIRKEFPHLTYLVAGDGPRHQFLQKLAQDLSIANQVKFLGPCSREELLAFYNQADLFVLPCLELAVEGDVEGFGIVFAEAAACGKPVVGGDSGGIPEVVLDGVTGLLVNPEDDEAVKNAILQLLQDPALAQKMGQAGRHWAEEELAWEKVAQRFDQELANLLA